MGAIERKFLDFKTAGMSVVEEDGRPVTVTGYGSTFGGDPDCYNDLIAPGAYRATIADWASRSYPLPMLLEHGQATVGKWTGLSEDQRGLMLHGELTPGHSVASDAAASLRHGAITGLSIGFRPTEWAWDDKTGIRTLTGIDLFEVSLVSTPANATARVTGVKASLTEGVCRAAFHIAACRDALTAHPDGDPLDAAAKARMVESCAKALQHLPDGDEDDDPKGLVRADGQTTLRDFERRARERLGLSRREAATLAERGFDGLLRLWEERATEAERPSEETAPTGDQSAPRDAAAESGANRLLKALQGLRLDSTPASGTNPRDH